MPALGGYRSGSPDNISSPISKAVGGQLRKSYTPDVDHEVILSEINPAASAELESKSVIVMIGEVLAAVAHYFDRRLGGPGILRRLASIAAAFTAWAVLFLVKRRATATNMTIAGIGNSLFTFLAHPPSTWAAP